MVFQMLLKYFSSSLECRISMVGKYKFKIPQSVKSHPSAVSFSVSVRRAPILYGTLGKDN